MKSARGASASSELSGESASVYTLEAWLDALFSQSGQMALVLDDEGVCKYVSPNWQDLTGYAPEDVLGAHLDLFIHPEDAAVLQAPKNTTENQAPCEYRFRHAGGKWQWHMAERMPTLGLSLAGSRLLLSRDVTRLKLTEHRLEQAKLSADIARKGRGKFLAHMHHELRTPLNAVIGFTEMMLAEMFGPIGNPRYRQYLDHIRESSQDLLETINNMLELASLTSGETQLDEDQVDVRLVVQQAVVGCMPYAAQRQVMLQQCLPQRATWLLADADKLRRAIQHILHNAIKFSPALQKVVISAMPSEDDSEGFAITIQDRGEGMSERKIRAVLQPFSIDNVTTSQEMRGAGIGLTLAKEFMCLHQGTLDISSARGQGTTVTLRFPVSRAATSPLQTPIPEKL